MTLHVFRPVESGTEFANLYSELMTVSMFFSKLARVFSGLLMLFAFSCMAVGASVEGPGARYVVVLRSSVDPQSFAREYHLTPSHHFESKLHAFAAPVGPISLQKLKQDKRVRSVELDGNSQMIVRLKPEADVDATVRELHFSPKHRYRHALRGFSINASASDLAKLNQDDRVASVEADGNVVIDPGSSTITQIVSASSVPGQVIPAGIHRMGVDTFPVAHIGKAGAKLTVDVAVLDTGIQIDTTAMNPAPSTGSHSAHPDLNVVQAVGFADAGLNGDDWSGHGTHVAGTIGALDNGIGAVGVAPGVRLWSVQVVGPNQHAISNLLAGLDYISQNAGTISVVNASITVVANDSWETLHEAVLNIVNQGVVFVAAAGNNESDLSGDFIWGNGDDNLPAAFAEVMSVYAMDPNPMQMSSPNPMSPSSVPNSSYDTIWNFSNYSVVNHNPILVSSSGLAMDLAGPGVNIFSTYKGGQYAFMTGTSMASPHAAGLVALYIAANGRGHTLDDVTRIRQKIIDNSQAQADWFTHGATNDPDGNPEPLAFPKEAWVPAPTMLTGPAKSSLSLEGVTYTAHANGMAGNSITVTITGGATAGSENVSVGGTNLTDITVQAETGVSTVAQIVAAVNANFQASGLVTASGNGPTTALPIGTYNLTDGCDGLVMTNQGFEVSFTTVPGYNYKVQYTDTLFPTNWQDLLTVPGTGHAVNAFDTTPHPVMRYYRVQRL